MRTALEPYLYVFSSDIRQMPVDSRSALPPASLFVENDALLLAAPLLQIASASEDKPRDGLVVIAGTGSLVMSVRAHHGQIRMTGRRGGLGFLFGDEGSGE
jgi:N-acetylglucosamine kinase-like BadF-type ATPase